VLVRLVLLDFRFAKYVNAVSGGRKLDAQCLNERAPPQAAGYRSFSRGIAFGV